MEQRLTSYELVCEYSIDYIKQRIRHTRKST